MKTISAKFCKHQCFSGHWAGFDAFRPVTVVVGKNNVGKTRLLELVERLCRPETIDQMPWEFRLESILEEEDLRPYFSDTMPDHQLGPLAWSAHGQKLVGRSVVFEFDGSRNCVSIQVDASDPSPSRTSLPQQEERVARIKAIAGKAFGTPLAGKRFVSLNAERAIRTETEDRNATISPDGSGATNTIRKFFYSADTSLPKGLIRDTILPHLNNIFADDGNFTSLTVQKYDFDGAREKLDHWEVYLEQAQKGQVPLSASGSGLQSVLLVLLNLHLRPILERRKHSEYCYAFEELESHLHPTVIRRLLSHIHSHATQHNVQVFLTTHSSTTLDVFGESPAAQIVHVSHDGVSGRTSTINAHLERVAVVASLGARPSDLLQANGIVWVEGPSDRIYINRWIQLASHGLLREGRDYQCAFIGGALLARDEFRAETDNSPLLANLLRINHNVAVIVDSDKPSADAPLKDRVLRVEGELSRIDGATMWCLDAREIENYLPGEVLCQFFGLADIPAPRQFESFFRRKLAGSDSFLTSIGVEYDVDKVELATFVSPLLTLENMRSRFDWSKRANELVSSIQRWARS